MCRLVHAYNSRFLQSPISTPVLRDSPWNLTYVDFAPSEQFTNARFYYSSPDMRGVCIVKDLCLEGSHISGGKSEEKKKKKRSSKARQGRIKHVRKISESLKNGVDICTFVRLSAKIAPSRRNYLYVVHIWCWAINMTSCWSHAVRSWNIWAKRCTIMPWSTWKRLV